MGVQYKSQGQLLLNGPRESSPWQRVRYQPLNDPWAIGNLGPDLQILDATRTSTAAITANEGQSGLARRTMVVERSLGEEPATSRMPPAERLSGEVHVATVDSDLHAAIWAHPPVDRSSTGEHETVDALTEPVQASTETGTEAPVPVMSNIAAVPNVDRTSTDLMLTSAPVAEEPRGDPAMVELFTPRFGVATQDSKVETSPGGHGRPPIVWGQGIQIRPSMNLPHP